MSTVYLVVPINYEYNDEIYYSNSDGFSKPEKGYRSKVKAEFISLGKNLEKLRGLHLGEYCYSLADIISDQEKFDAICERNGINTNDPWSSTIPSSISDQDLKELYDSLDLPFYKVIPAEVED